MKHNTDSVAPLARPLATAMLHAISIACNDIYDVSAKSLSFTRAAFHTVDRTGYSFTHLLMQYPLCIHRLRLYPPHKARQSNMMWGCAVLLVLVASSDCKRFSIGLLHCLWLTALRFNFTPFWQRSSGYITRGNFGHTCSMDKEAANRSSHLTQGFRPYTIPHKCYLVAYV